MSDEVKRYEFSCPDGELDEVFLSNASVHIERMDNHYKGLVVQRPRQSVQIPAVKLQQRIAALEAENARLKCEREQMLEALRRYEEAQQKFEEQVARLTAPVSEEEIEMFFHLHNDSQLSVHWVSLALGEFIAARASQKESESVK